MTDQVYCVLDYETFSEADLKKVGAFEYAVHPSTEVICMAWKIGTKQELKTADINSWTPLKTGQQLGDLISALLDPAVKLVAHNALFEQLITKHVFASKYMYSMKERFQLPPDRWICTAAQASALALPRNLEGAASALKLPVQKDMEGRRLILKWCKPRKATKHDDSPRHTDYTELNRLIEYCKTDVETETHLFLNTPELSPTERQIWLLDQVINQRGFLVDREMVTAILKMVETESRYSDKRADELTMGMIRSVNQRGELLDIVRASGLDLPNLQKKTVDDALKAGVTDPVVNELLQLRQSGSKTSTAKYAAFEMRSRHDGRVRDILVYHAASTGRWGGAGVQPQNFPRGTFKNSLMAVEDLKTGDLEMIRLLYGSPMEVFSSCLRNAIMAPKGYTFDVADYAAIEARVLSWVADHKAGLKAFRDGRDLYIEQAASVFGRAPESIGRESFERWLGKTIILGCGFGMGVEKFIESCEAQGQIVSKELAKVSIDSYREIHHPVPALWRKYNMAAMAAVENMGKKYSVNHTSWYKRGNFLYCELPSGRRLAYADPQIREALTPWGERRPTLFHYGVDSLTKKWVLAKTYGGKLVENVVQATARDIMAAAMLRIEAAGPWKIVLSVHDELIAERRVNSKGTNSEFCNLMATLPDWANGCPIKVEGWEGSRYRK